MKYDAGPRHARNRARALAIREWHSWFAWHPARDGARVYYWLETIERRGYGDERLYWEYRPRANR